MNAIRNMADKVLPPLGSRQLVRLATLMATTFLLLLGYMYFQFPLSNSISSSFRSSKQSSDPQVEFVVASLKGDDVSWLHEYIPQWKAHVYIVNDQKAPLTVPKNKGREAMVYLTHIITNYDHLPDILVFIHSLRYQWHNDDPLYDGVPLMQSLQTKHILNQGYANLRCVWTLGCPAELHPHEENNRPEADQAGKTQEVYASAFQVLFPGKTVPDIVGVGCCAQFAVTRDTIRRRSLEDYTRYRDWLLTNELDDGISGRVLEYSWHLIFGKPAVHCPNAKECYCLTYGLCNLTCDSERQCGERWHFPPSASLPQGWPEIGWNGEHRTPVELEAARYEAMEVANAKASVVPIG